MVVGMLGILKAGGAYLPLDGEYPVERLRYMVEDAQTGIIVANGKNAGVLRGSSVRIVNLELERPEIQKERESQVASGAGANSLAYVMYTSGSTGRPKAIMVEHKGICNLFYALKEKFRLNEGDSVPIGFFEF